MGNLLHADFYRLGKGVAVRNTIICLIAVFCIVLATTVASRNGSFGVALSNTDGVTEQDLQDFTEMESMLPQSGAGMILSFITQEVIAFFILPLAIAVFAQDFSTGTYRNTLSFETNRKKIYFSKMIITSVLTVGLLLSVLVFGMLSGGVLLGFGEFGGAFFKTLGIILALQIPVYFALVSILHSVIAFTKKSGTAIAVILVYMFTSSIIVQLVMMFFPKAQFIQLFDLLSILSVVGQYSTISFSTLLACLAVPTAVGIVATVAGVMHYSKTDLN